MKLMPHDKAWLRARRRRPYGEVRRIAREEGVSYHRLLNLCARYPGIETRELARTPPADAAEAGRRGGTRSAEMRRRKK